MFCNRVLRHDPSVNRPIGLGIACVLLAILFAGCAATPMIGGPLEQRKLKAGTYEGVYMGGPNKVVVMVTIEDNRIVHIEMVEHWELMGKEGRISHPEKDHGTAINTGRCGKRGHKQQPGHHECGAAGR